MRAHLARIHLVKVFHDIQHSVSDFVFIQIRGLCKESQKVKRDRRYSLRWQGDTRGQTDVCQNQLPNGSASPLQRRHFNIKFVLATTASLSRVFKVKSLIGSFFS